MFTLHHALYIYFFTRRHPQVWQFVVGSMLPDYVYFVVLFLALIRGQILWEYIPSMSPYNMMFLMSMYPWGLKADLIGHSVVIWGVVFMVTLLPVVRRLQAFVIGWGSHLLIDGLTHGAYANYFIYPLSLYAVHSPVSYWEPEYFATEFRVVNWTIMALLAGWLIFKWWQKKYTK